jgi:hypothetical protein
MRFASRMRTERQHGCGATGGVPAAAATWPMDAQKADHLAARMK